MSWREEREREKKKCNIFYHNFLIFISLGTTIYTYCYVLNNSNSKWKEKKWEKVICDVFGL